MSPVVDVPRGVAVSGVSFGGTLAKATSTWLPGPGSGMPPAGHGGYHVDGDDEALHARHKPRQAGTAIEADLIGEGPERSIAATPQRRRVERSAGNPPPPASTERWS